MQLLQTLKEEVGKCTACALHKERAQIVFDRGNSQAKILFLGEAPGANEDIQGIPFCGKSGKLLDNMILAMKLDPAKDVYICNINKCRPPGNRKPEPEEMAACKPFLNRQIAAVAPKVIVALGATAIVGICGPGEGITRRRGRWDTYNGIPVMPTLHPAYCLRTPAAKHDVWLDLKQVMLKIEELDGNNRSKSEV